MAELIKTLINTFKAEVSNHYPDAHCRVVIDSPPPEMVFTFEVGVLFSATMFKQSKEVTIDQLEEAPHGWEREVRSIATELTWAVEREINNYVTNYRGGSR